MLARREAPQTAATVKMDDCLSGIDLGRHTLSSIQKNSNKRRFSDEQIKFLEVTFESESRPESQMKQQLASELGLQPRQVAIWFQNRRARLKTKQIEREYNILKASYDDLASSFESLKRENQSLIIQLKKLKNLQLKHHRSGNQELGQTESGTDSKFETRDTDSESKDKPSLLLEDYGHEEDNQDKPSSDHNSRNITSTVEETDILRLTEGTDGSMTSPDWHGLESDCFLDTSSCSSQWWEFMS